MNKKYRIRVQVVEYSEIMLGLELPYILYDGVSNHLPLEKATEIYLSKIIPLLKEKEDE